MGLAVGGADNLVEQALVLLRGLTLPQFAPFRAGGKVGHYKPAMSGLRLVVGSVHLALGTLLSFAEPGQGSSSKSSLWPGNYRCYRLLGFLPDGAILGAPSPGAARSSLRWVVFGAGAHIRGDYQNHGMLGALSSKSGSGARH